MQGLYGNLSNHVSALDKKIYNKSSMIGISHAMEDIVLHFGFKAEMYVFFQDFKFFRFEKEKYLKLDGLCQKIYIFAKNMRYDEISDFKNTVFIDLKRDSPFCDEWNVVVCHPEQSMVFSSSELYAFSNLGDDTLRRFSGFLSFSPVIAHEAAAFIAGSLADYGEAYTPVYGGTVLGPETESALDVKVSFFINRALNEIEAKSETIVHKNQLLSAALKENDELSLEMLKRLCFAAEYKDEDSALHLIRMSYYSARLYSQTVSDKAKIKQVLYASLMHDIGKIGIPDYILFKPASLTTEEFAIMKTHCLIGSNILSGSKRELIRTAQEIALCHHEKWNGTGYPAGTSGAQIPLTARIVAISDVFDALLSRRVYKDAYPVETCVSILRDERGRHFDGELVDLFLSDVDEFLSFRDKIKALSEQSSVKSLFTDYFIELD